LVPEERGLFGIGYAGLQPELPPLIREIKEGYPAQLGGLKEADVILAIDGEEIRHWIQMAMIIWDNPGKTLTFKVKRGHEIRFFPITPKAVKTGEKTIGLIGISNPGDTILKRYGPIGAIVRGGLETIQVTRRTITVLWKLVVRKISFRAVGGPISIFKMTGAVAKTGIRELMVFIASLSITLAIINVLPIPVLDGGHLLFLGIEGIRRKPLGLRTREFAYRVGLVIIITLMFLVIYGDIVKWFLKPG
jgi:regulator of sigma E protease